MTKKIIILIIVIILLANTANAATALYAFLKDVEEDNVVKLKAYKDSGGVWTIGYGSIYNFDLKRRVREGDTITKEQAQKFLEIEANTALETVKNLVKVPLSKNQQVALGSFIYNVGITGFTNSTLLKLINQKANRTQIEAEFRKWVYDNGKFVKGLLNRRNAEIALYFS